VQDSKDKRKKEPDHAETQSLDEQVLHSAGGDATRRIRTFVQDLERFLKDEKRRPELDSAGRPHRDSAFGGI